MHKLSFGNRAPRWIAAIGLLVLAGLVLLGLAGPGTSSPAGAAAPTLAQAQAELQAKIQKQSLSRPLPRESGPPSNGPAPRTGPASPFEPLVDPIFGDNYRANTDSQSPNLAQQEPSMAVNPTNPLNVVVMAKDERAGSNTKQDWIYTSTDGGVTWINQQFPLASPASPRSSDPIVNFSDDGQVYVTALPYGGSSTDGIQVARSTDGGITFSTGVHLPGSNINSDKEWTWVDNFPSSPFYHRIYTAWMNFGSGYVIGFNYSSDRGVTWSPLVNVGSAEQFPMPVVLPNGDVIVTDYGFSGGVEYRRSTDGGQTFGAVNSISSITDPNCPPDNPNCSIWRLNAIPANSVNPNNGTQVVVWADGRNGSDPALTYYSRSTDNGSTWSAAAQLAPPGAANVYQVEPWVATDELGNFHAIWYDDRDNPNTSIFNIYYSESTDNGATWSTATRISTATSDLRIGIPSSYAQAAGDYINVTASHGNVYACWTDTRSGTGEDVYVVRGIYGGTPTPTVTGTPPTNTPTPMHTNTPTPSDTVPPSNTPLPPSPTNTPGHQATETAPPTSTAPAATSTVAETETATPGPPTATATACTITFTDVPPGSTFYSYVHCLACLGIINGYPNGTFRPNNNVTRGQLSKIVSNSAGFDDTPTGQQFQDVPPSGPGSTFYVYIYRLAVRGFIGGYPCGSVASEPCVPPANLPYFRPNNNATRGQISKIVSNAAGFNDTPSGQQFEDVPSGSTFYAYIYRLATRNVMQGYPCGSHGEPCIPPNFLPYFRPNNNATRGQTSKIVANTFFPDCGVISGR